ncbi:MarR family winged helix-turn-helix transcriptional regulator [Streptomyces spiramenti]|uniref:MarR family transcriptional regulator n=1 Tax=Streptomyces spiramenti TaxID=2720606 RepID=A0ABX1AGJ2_9ACTN|nr:MarR family transcriptional regulator [Streptomyces spiramenti]NJP66309.1 MarR family transcriptional regulator [Streptomyces spiramenti]
MSVDTASGHAETREASQANQVRYLILAAQREGNRQLAQNLRPHGLTPAQAEILVVLSTREPLTLAELGRFIVCESGSPSRIVDALVRRGAVSRAPGLVDRRVVHLHLTTEGRELLAAIRDVDSAVAGAIADRINPDQLQVLVTALRGLVDGTDAGAKVTRRFGS